MMFRDFEFKTGDELLIQDKDSKEVTVLNVNMMQNSEGVFPEFKNTSDGILKLSYIRKNHDIVGVNRNGTRIEFMPDGYAYQFLPDGLFVGGSSIDGKGLFSHHKLFEFDVFRRSHLIVGDRIERLYGGLLNHSITPNCKLNRHVDHYNIVVDKGIEAGDELTVNYFDEDCGVGKVSDECCGGGCGVENICANDVDYDDGGLTVTKSVMWDENTISHFAIYYADVRKSELPVSVEKAKADFINNRSVSNMINTIEHETGIIMAGVSRKAVASDLRSFGENYRSK